MGVPGLWDVLSIAAEKASLTSIATNLQWRRTQNSSSDAKNIKLESRRLRIAIDVSIWAFQLSSVRVGPHSDLQTLFYRLCRLWRLGIEAVFVFDGPERPAWKRGHYVLTASKRTKEKEAEYIYLLKIFGFPVHRARGEAEAECAILQQRGHVDWVLTEDVDAFLFGADAVMRNWTSINTLKKKKGMESTEDEELARLLKGIDEDEKRKGKVKSRAKTIQHDSGNTHTYVPIFKADNIQDTLDLDQDGLILVALLSGSDYIPQGAANIGIRTAVALARAGWGRRMCDIIRSGKEQHDFSKLRRGIEYEIRTNSSGLLTCCRPSIRIPDDFPDEGIVRSYLFPCTTIEGLGDSFEFRWGERPDLAAIATWCCSTCNWEPSSCLKTLIQNLFPGIAIWDLQKSFVSAPLTDPTLPKGILQTPVKPKPKPKPKPTPSMKTPSKSKSLSSDTPNSTQTSITNFFSVTKQNKFLNPESNPVTFSSSAKLSATTSVTLTTSCSLNSTYPTITAIHSYRRKDDVDELRVEWANAAIQSFADEAIPHLACARECIDTYPTAIRRCWIPTTTIRLLCSDQIKAFKFKRDRSGTRRTLKKTGHPLVDRDGLKQMNILDMVDNMARKEHSRDEGAIAKLDVKDTIKEERKNKNDKCVDSMAPTDIDHRIVTVKLDKSTLSKLDVVTPSPPRRTKVLKMKAAGGNALKARMQKPSNRKPKGVTAKDMQELNMELGLVTITEDKKDFGTTESG